MPVNLVYIDYRPGDPKHQQKLDGIRRYAASREWDVTGVPHDEVNPERVAELLDEIKPDGCVVDANEDQNTLRPSMFGRLPIVYVDLPGRKPWMAKQWSVANDNTAIAKMAYRELSVGNPPSFAVATYRMRRAWARQRTAVFRALCELGGKECAVLPEHPYENQAERAERLMRWVASLPDGCAIFAVNDYTAGEIMLALSAAGRSVPSSATVLGVDGSDMFPASPASDDISTILVDFERAGFIAARLLARRIDAANSVANGKLANIRPENALFGPLLVLRRASTRGCRGSSPVVTRAIAKIRHEATSGLTARDLAATIPGSRKHFERRFREATGHSVLEEILSVRLERVQALLGQLNVPIGIIAQLCGFGSDIELKRLFRRRTGMSMRQWRNRYIR